MEARPSGLAGTSKDDGRQGNPAGLPFVVPAPLSSFPRRCVPYPPSPEANTPLEYLAGGNPEGWTGGMADKPPPTPAGDKPLASRSLRPHYIDCGETQTHSPADGQAAARAAMPPPQQPPAVAKTPVGLGLVPNRPRASRTDDNTTGLEKAGHAEDKPGRHNPYPTPGFRPSPESRGGGGEVWQVPYAIVWCNVSTATPGCDRAESPNETTLRLHPCE